MKSLFQRPYWVSYPDMVKLADGNPVIVKTDFAQQFKMTPAQLNACDHVKYTCRDFQ